MNYYKNKREAKNMKKYKVQMLVTGTITKIIEADSPEEAKEIANEKYGDQSVHLCSSCSNLVEDLSVLEDPDTYEVEEIDDSMVIESR